MNFTESLVDSNFESSMQHFCARIMSLVVEELAEYLTVYWWLFGNNSCPSGRPIEF